MAALAELPEVELTVVVTHGATAMSLCNALLGISQRVHPLGALANCHWTELSPSTVRRRRVARARRTTSGSPGAVVPLPARDRRGPEPSDAERLTRREPVRPRGDGGARYSAGCEHGSSCCPYTGRADRSLDPARPSLCHPAGALRLSGARPTDRAKEPRR